MKCELAERPTDDIVAKLTEALESGVSERAVEKLKKSVEDILYEVETDIMYRLKDDLAPNLSGFAKEMAEKTVEALLAGNEAEMRRYLSCREGGWTGRDRDHPVIHGKLFEPHAIEVRRKIVEAHRDLITDERILDLEDQVASLVKQVNALTEQLERSSQRLRGYL